MSLWDIPERPDLEARLAELDARLVAEEDRRDVAEARLAAVIARIDGPHCNCDGYDENALNATGCYVAYALRAVRAAATGDTT